MKNKAHFKFILSSERGSVAIMMVLTAVALLTPLMINFTFDTNIAKLKVYNIEQKAKSKLTAESALKFAMARLQIYKEGYNFLQNNETAKKNVKQETLDMLWNFPFVYPIPITSQMNAIQKETINKFHEETNLEGSFQLTINNISNKINLNMIRFSSILEASKGEVPDDQKPTEEEETYSAENQLFNALKNGIEKKSETDDIFFAKYGAIDINDLINELKLYISDKDSLENPGNALGNFDQAELTPKYAPIISFSELYTLPTWSDDLVKLIENEFTVHGAIMIDLNQLTDKMLRLLFPEITDDEVKEYFEYKNDPEDPKHYNTLEEFKNYIVNIGNIATASDFDELFAKFKKMGLQFGPTPTLFKIISSAKNDYANYTITAYVVLPAQPQPRKTKPNTENPQNPPLNPENPESPENPPQNPPANPNGGEEEKEQKTLLLEPRIVEIIIS